MKGLSIDEGRLTNGRCDELVLEPFVNVKSPIKRVRRGLSAPA